jgi:small subunit ribosomal protein S4
MVLKPGSTVTLAEPSRSISRITSALEALEGRSLPPWLEIDKATFQGTVKTLPAREDMTLPIQEQLVVELYSR